MTKWLIVFIDSLPYERLSLTRFISGLPTQVRLIPGLGYSVNLLPELFLGLTPDAVGFYSEWVYEPVNSPFRSRPIGKILQIIAQSHYYADRLIHKGLGRILRANLAQVPFDLLPYFSHCGKSIYLPPLSERAIFSLPGPPFNLVLAEQIRSRGMGERDRSALSISLRKFPANLFLSLVDLDSYGHKYGVESFEHNQFIMELDQRIALLWKTFCDNNIGNDCRLIVLSDHGMSNVTRGVNLDLQKTFGPPNPSKYIYFLDSTILRIWTEGDKVHQNIQDYLAGREEGRLLTAEERRSLGVSESYAGDLLYVLNEGYVFLPSFHSLKLSKGMHGYHPNVSLQHAVLAYSEKFDVPSSLRTVEVFGLLQSLITGL